MKTWRSTVFSLLLAFVAVPIFAATTGAGPRPHAQHHHHRHRHHHHHRK